MLFVTLRIGIDRYALDTQRIVAVLPIIHVKAIPGTAPGVAGIFNYYGRPVPLIDLTELTTGSPAASRMSTRIIVANFALDSEEEVLLGLRAEHVTETIRRTPEDFVDSGVTVKDGAYLGPVTMKEGEIIQLLDPGRLLSESVLSQLRRQVAGPGQWNF